MQEERMILIRRGKRKWAHGSDRSSVSRERSAERGRARSSTIVGDPGETSFGRVSVWAAGDSGRVGAGGSGSRNGSGNRIARKAPGRGKAIRGGMGAAKFL